MQVRDAAGHTESDVQKQRLEAGKIAYTNANRFKYNKHGYIAMTKLTALHELLGVRSEVAVRHEFRDDSESAELEFVWKVLLLLGCRGSFKVVTQSERVENVWVG